MNYENAYVKAILWCVMVAVATWVIYSFKHANTSDSTPSATPLTATLSGLLQTPYPQIKIYSIEGHPSTYEAITIAKMYGFPVVFVPINSMEDLKQQIPQLSNIDKISAPVIVLSNGQLIDLPTFTNAVVPLPIKNFHEGKQPQQVILYGIENCPYTDSARRKLNELGVNYQYIDINTDPGRYLGELDARARASGYYDGIQQPIIEYNNMVRPRDGLNTIWDQLTR